ncbi:MAG: hypothetical protein ACRDSR_15415 [Pseudonocardiaceae bacterium]
MSTAGRGTSCYRCPGQGGTTGHVVRTAGPLDAYIEAVIVERLSRPDAIELLRPAAPEVDLSALRATANATRARLTEITEMLGEGELTRVEAQSECLLTCGMARRSTGGTVVRTGGVVACHGELDVNAGE